MKTLKTETKVEIHEKDGADIAIGAESEYLLVESHWNYGDRIVLRFSHFARNITVTASDLKRAIENAEYR